MSAVSLLARIILPRPGEPLDVRKLYIEESNTNARRAHAATRTTLQIGAESEVSFSTYFNAFPASYWRRWSTLQSVVLRAELTGTGRVDVYRSKATGARIFVEGRPFHHDGDEPQAVEFEIGLEPFEDGGWIWFDITTRQPGHPAERRLVRAGARAGHGEHRGGHSDVQPARRLRQRAAGADVRPVGRQRDRRSDRAGPGHGQGARPPGLRRGRRAARHPAVDPRPTQPRRFRRLQPRHVRGAEEHRLSADPVHGRRHPRRAGLDPAGAGDEPVRQDADARRRSDAQPSGSGAPARDGRGGRPGRLHVDQRAAYQVRPRLRSKSVERPVLRQQAAAPPHRRRLQRLVDVHDPARGRRRTGPAAAAVHQVGRRRLRAAGRRARLSHRHHAGHRDLAHGVERQGRRHRLAGLLPPAESVGGRGVALGRRRAWPGSQPSEGHAETSLVP